MELGLFANFLGRNNSLACWHPIREKQYDINKEGPI